MTIRELQRLVAETWTLDSYSEAFKANTLPHRDFQHALVHAMKAAGKLAAAVDEVEHGGEWPQDHSKYLADLVICAARMAAAWPKNGDFYSVDLSAAVFGRLERNAAVNAATREGGQSDG